MRLNNKRRINNSAHQIEGEESLKFMQPQIIPLILENQALNQ